MKPKKLNKTVRDHGMWLRGEGGARADLRGVDLSEANLDGVDLCYADLCGVDLSDANLCGADLCRANLCGANLSKANLCGANLCGANLSDANLCGACLSEANLREANLDGVDLTNIKMWGTIGNNREIKSIQTGRYPVAYTSTVMQIGCKRHDISEWWAFDDARINRMDRHALEWWNKWKPILQQIIEVSPAAPAAEQEKPS